MKKQILLVVTSIFMLASCTSTGVNNGGTTPPTGTTPPPVTPLPPVPSEVYVVQLIASSSKAKADRIRDQFIGDGYQAVVDTITGPNGLLHRVQIGAYNTEVEAIQQLNLMRQRYAGAGNVHVNNAVVKPK